MSGHEDLAPVTDGQALEFARRWVAFLPYSDTSTDFDVVGDDGNLVGNGSGIPKMSGLVAVSGLELESTEFDSTGSYAPNDKLTAGAPGDAGCSCAPSCA